MRFSMFVATGVAVMTAMPAMAQDGRSWTGPYAGISAGLDFQGNDSNAPVEFDTNLDGTFGDTVRTTAGADAFSRGFCGGRALGPNPTGCRRDSDRLGYAGHVGYDVQFGNIVVGAVGEFGNSNIVDSSSAYSTTPARYAFVRSMDWNAQGRLRAGYAMGDTLPYVTGGAALARVDRGFETSNGANSFTQDRDKRNAWGWTAGGGVEQRVSDNFSIGVLYTYTTVNDRSPTVRVGRGTALPNNPFLLVNSAGTDMRRSDNRFDWHSARVRASFRF
ncbi:outer membrane protein [Sphingomonas hankookensis]|uniref:outer membrane protein n=1 Tax=Sphingomonas hankookensis TaxID=563996 RepID=UPI001F56D6F6|nr:outer membrane beta-barrel protein [Sphingomonas hankookensis]